MTSASVELQDLVVALLRANAAVTGFVGSRIYNVVPSSAAYPYISFGPHDIVEDGADCIESGEHTLQIDVWSRPTDRSPIEAKQIVDAIKKCLHNSEAQLADNAMAEMTVGFRQVFPDIAAGTLHGVVRLTAIIEEID